MNLIDKNQSFLVKQLSNELLDSFNKVLLEAGNIKEISSCKDYIFYGLNQLIQNF